MGATCGSEGTSGPELNDNPQQLSDRIREMFEQAGQGHCFNAWQDMDQREKQVFLQQCQQFDVNQMNTLFQNLVVTPQGSNDADAAGAADFDTIDPEYVVDKTKMADADKSDL